ncbi:hypothetical protein ACFLQR_03680 [Verrucomicrobiota bacterium]
MKLIETRGELMTRLTTILTAIVVAVLVTTHAVAEEQPAKTQKPPASAKPDTVVTGIVQKISGSTKQLFRPLNVDPALVRASMQARSEYDALTRQIITRQKKLYEENASIKKLQANMQALQKQIDGILASDEELAKLKEKFKSISPQVAPGKRQPLRAPSPAPSAVKK